MVLKNHLCKHQNMWISNMWSQFSCRGCFESLSQISTETMTTINMVRLMYWKPRAACRPKYLWGHKQLSWPRTPGPLLACCGLKCVAASLTPKQAAARTVFKNKAATWWKRWHLRAESDKEEDGILIFTAVDADFFFFLVSLLGTSLAWVQSCAPRCGWEAFVIPR